MFHQYGASHVAMLAVFVAGIPAAVALGRAQLDQRRLGRVAAAVLVAVGASFQVILNVKPGHTFAASLPLELCDLAWMAAAWALWTHHRVPVALTYYWGLVLTPQAIITPSLTADFPDVRFFAYWAKHLLIVWSAIYLTWGLRLRPDWTGYRRTVGITAAWAVVVFVFNTVTGTNYGYLSHKPTSASILDYLGPWPAYIVAEILLITAVWALMTWPWQRGDDRSTKTPADRGRRGARSRSRRPG